MVNSRDEISLPKETLYRRSANLAKELRQGLTYTIILSCVPRRSSRSPVLGDYRRVLVSRIFES